MRESFAEIMAAVAILNVAAQVGAQVTPEREYYGVGRTMAVRIGGEGEQEGAANQVRLFGAGEGREIARAKCEPGTIDLARAFPMLWDANGAHVQYVQAYRGDEPIGPALVLQPMVTPAYAPRVDRDGAPAFMAPSGRGRVFTGYRAYVDRQIVLETSKGAITIALRPEAAPNTAWAVRELAAGGFYTDILVHRVASLGGQAEPDVIQFGDPSAVLEGKGAEKETESNLSTASSSGAKVDEAEVLAGTGAKPVKAASASPPAKVLSGGLGGAGFLVDLEQSTLRNDFGVVSMARGSDPNSGSSQIVIALNRSRCAAMDGRYAAFGEVVGGAEALMALAHTPVDFDYRPLDPPVIKSARLVDAPPYPKRPGRVADPRTQPVER